MKLFAAVSLCVIYVIGIHGNSFEFNESTYLWNPNYPNFAKSVLIYPDPQKPIHSSLERVSGGHDAEPNSAKYMCSMQLYRRHYCGCSILSDRWLLTAAHCVEG